MTNIDRFITIAELAETLTVSVPTIRVWIRRGKIPRHCYIKVSQTYRFDLKAIQQALMTDVEVPESSPMQLELDFDTPIDQIVLDDDNNDNQ
jgi:excisionase family DNA binding protein